MEQNKYNLQVGDVIRIISSWRIKEVKEEGIIFDRGLHSWGDVNFSLDKGNWEIVSRVKKEFPKQWSIKGSKEFERFLREGKIDKNSWAGWNESYYYNFDGEKLEDWDSGGYNTQKYELVTIEQLKKHYLQKSEETNQQPPIMENKEKKIIGYKLVKKEYLEAVKVMVSDSWTWNYAEENILKSGWHFAAPDREGEGIASIFRKAGVLDLWFEPVYEIEYKEVKVSVGSPAKEILVTSKGQISVKDVNYSFSMDELIMLKNKFRIVANVALLDVFVKNLWVGCSAGTSITEQDIDLIIETYNELNSKQ